MLKPSTVLAAMTTVCGLALLYTAIGAAGTDATLRWPQRLAFWSVCALFCFPVCYSKSVVALYLLDSRPFRQVVLGLTVATAFTAITATALIYTIDRILLPEHPAQNLIALYAWVFPPMLFGTIFILYLVSRKLKSTEPVDASREVSADHRDTGLPSAVAFSEAPMPVASGQAPAPRSPLLGRLVKPGRDVIYLKMNDHYVETVTSTGNEIILMRFADAVAQLAGLGMQVHRSYWVSYRHVVRLIRDRHRRFLELSGGHNVPVSRTYLSTVRLTLDELGAGRAPRDEALTGGEVDSHRASGAGGDTSPLSPESTPPVTPPQRQFALGEKIPILHRLIHTTSRRSTTAAAKPNVQTPRSQQRVTPGC